MFAPSCLPILIGSLPLADHLEAIELILVHTPEIPLWPQLPRLAKEGMIRQFISGLPGLVDEGNRFWLNTDHKNFAEEMAQFYQDYMLESESQVVSSESRFALTDETAPGFSTFLQVLSEDDKAPFSVKGQVTGPMTTGIGVTDKDGKAIFYDDNLRDIVTKCIAMKARWQVEQLTPYAGLCPPIVFIDEPGMVSFGSTAYTSVTKEMVTDAVQEVITAIKSAGGLAGVHICANGDWTPVLESDADLISFDSYSYFANFTLYKNSLLSFIERGGLLVWGIVPTGDPLAVERESLESLFNIWIEQLETMAALGISQDTLIRQTFIAPSCGTGSLSVAQATKVLSLTSGLADMIRDHFSISS